jgi:2-polyprenyl-3-methyl-5-hydroxy-6-metoxy-1,4-benzoquinol methylase
LGAKKPHGAFPTIMKQLIKDTLPEPVVQNIARVRNTLRYSIGANRTPRISKTASPKLHKLREAWSIARKSDASAPGVPVCYYEITEDGYRFPGERPWDERWTVLRGITPLRGKRILELGCNLSLLSCFALKEEGAENALCVDVDSKILAAAQLIADAYGVTPLYKRVDFDSRYPWEKELLSFKPDVVTALSVLNWVRDKERFLQFLANFNEVIFEGHEPFEVEKARFLQVGFTRIREVSVSERARPIMLCQK